MKVFSTIFPGKVAISLLLSLCLFSQSCDQKTLEVNTPHEQTATVEDALKVSASAHFRTVFEEATRVKKLMRRENIKMAKLSEATIQQMLSTCKNEADLEQVFSKISDKPREIMNSIYNINTALTKLDNETHFSQLPKEARKDLFSQAILINKSVSTISVLDYGADVPYLNDCGGVCNNSYNRSMDNAAQALILATVVSWGAGMVGGPAGMAAGALGIAGAVGAYYLATSLYLDQLGDCFETCR